MIWILIAILVVLVLVGIAAIVLAVKNKEKKQEPDYYAFFVMGISWIPLGIVFMATGNMALSFFLILGIVYMIFGLANKDKWKKNHKTWNKLSEKERNFKTIMIILLVLLVIMGLVTYILVA